MKIVGVDVGTMNIVSAQQVNKDKIETNNMRNMFIEISTDVINAQELSNTKLEYVIAHDDNGEIETAYIIGEDAFKFAQIFGKDVRRPMSKGVISTQEIDAVDVLTLMMEKLISKGRKDGTVIYSIPAQAVDIDTPPVLYHEKVFGKVFESLGYKSKPINEGMAIVYSNCADSQFSGIGISFGAGLTNVCCSYKGTTTLSFSVSRGGDWIDQSVADSLGISKARVTSIKERDLDLVTAFVGNKKEKRVREALQFYYSNLIEYILKVIVKYFNQQSQGLNINEDIPIIISGGTCLPKGFVDLFKEIFSKSKDFPYTISTIRQATDPLSAVAVGCLIYGLWENKKIDTQPNQNSKEKNDENKGNKS